MNENCKKQSKADSFVFHSCKFSRKRPAEHDASPDNPPSSEILTGTAPASGLVIHTDNIRIRLVVPTSAAPLARVSEGLAANGGKLRRE
jgi:hypothetical protein